MALDPTARETNVRDSVKKYFVDSMHPTYHLMFDKGMSKPNVQGTPSEVDRWVSINFGRMDRGTLSEHDLRIYCCTRKDNEGFRLAQLSDAVVGYLSDDTATHGMKTIPLYRSYENQAWTLIGGLLVQEIIESQQNTTDDETKYKILNVRLRWGSKI